MMMAPQAGYYPQQHGHMPGVGQMLVGAAMGHHMGGHMGKHRKFKGRKFKGRKFKGHGFRMGKMKGGFFGKRK